MMNEEQLWVRKSQLQYLIKRIWEPGVIKMWEEGIAKGYTSPSWALVSEMMFAAKEVLDERKPQTLPPDVELF